MQILCISPIDAMDWVVMLLAMAWSLFFLLNNLWRVISEHLTKEKMLPVLAVIRYAFYCDSWRRFSCMVLSTKLIPCADIAVGRT